MRAAPVWKLLALALAGFGLLCVLVVLVQRHLMYFPERFPEPLAEARAARTGLRAWRGPAGQLLGWRAAAAPVQAAPGVRFLVLHGNAGSALDRTYYAPVLAGEVRILEYPGYGPRPGSPSQPALVAAAADALAQLRAEASGPVWLLGESLGSGVACAVAAQRPDLVDGLLLVTPLARMTDVAAWHYPGLPVRLLLRDRWDSVEAASRYPGPVGLVIAGRDEVVGAEQGRILARAFGPRAWVWEQPVAGHNSLDLRPDAQPWPAVRAWLDSAAVGAAAR